jgi:hypothetical protein
MRKNQTEPTVSPASDRARGRALAFCARLILRVCAVGGIVLSVWVIVGSLWFPEWWYAAIWRGDFLNRGYLAYGWSYLLDSDRWLLLCMLLIAAVAAMYFYLRRGWFISIVDRVAPPSIIVFTALLAVDALFLHQPKYENKADLMERMSTPEFQALLDGAWTAKPSPSEIFPPVDFHYLDSTRVNGLYSEIEPDLIETERSISLSKKLAGSASVEAGAASLKGEAAKETEETSKFERSDASAERKCVLLMNFVLKNGTAHYFTTIRDFYGQRELSRVLEAGRIAYQEALKKTDPTTLTLVPPIDESPGKLSPEQRLAVAKRIEAWNQAFRKEARGFVVVDGTFRIARTDNNIVFEEEFSPRPQYIAFRLTLPAKLDADVFRDGARMRVFGDVIPSSNDMNTLTIHPVAIFNE